MTNYPAAPRTTTSGLTFELDAHDVGTRVSLTQDNNASQEEADRATANWSTMLDGLKKTVEDG
ncbi:SRPBCC domain-containing protein [Mycobacterium seoulense]|uniref:SRPBCC domain-containing protein n=1 Tax=Mycobacterium seoulense TaxID=386911 RepID=UPI003CF685E8